MRRSFLAVAAGFLLTALLSLGTDIALHAAGLYPPWGERMSDGLFLVATAYRLGFTVLGGYATARLAPRAPMRHGLWLGGVGTLVALASAIATWNAGLGPHWYPVALMVTALPCVLCGARLGLARWHVATGAGRAPEPRIP
ncbi:MAG: hypothetical protein QM767_12670 [Anaeromyxobacter sp.]